MTPPSSPRRSPGAPAGVDAVFTALADPTRRAVLRGVVDRSPVTATELAHDLPISRQAVAKHLGILRDAGLVEPSRHGRETRFTAQPEALAPVARWMEDTSRAWSHRLTRLERLVTRRTDGPVD